MEVQIRVASKLKCIICKPGKISIANDVKAADNHGSLYFYHHECGKLLEVQARADTQTLGI
jgi:hypothetical protein